MREQKYRAWDKSNKLMTTIQQIKYCSNGSLRSISLWTKEKDTAYTVHPTKVELMQYIGRKDKNKTEIYEGDIMHVHWTNGFSWGTGYLKGEVIFQKGAFAIRRHESDHYYFCNFKHIDELTEFKVIGNIYENPELMKNETKEY